MMMMMNTMMIMIMMLKFLPSKNPIADYIWSDEGIFSRVQITYKQSYMSPKYDTSLQESYSAHGPSASCKSQVSPPFMLEGKLN